jgi:asparagine synthase (glutamine-hydrolysing)
MCGIYGIAASDGDLGAPATVRRLLAHMDHAIRHRGPDDSGTYLDARCALGMRRLAIIDLDGGRQPIANEDRQVWVVFNGEIYNYRALRAELQARGHRFATATDTEVIVHLYEDRGDAFVEALDGMFAIALWDRRREQLVLARDRFGQKPLYFAETARGLVFASELKALLEHPSVSRDLSMPAISHYLSFGTTPDGESICKGARKLPPAHVAVYRRGQLSMRRYWDLRVRPRVVDDANAVAELRHRLREAVRAHLVADVDVGAFLSGGVDSATVVSLMAELGARPKTFSIGFEDPAFDELAWARLVARRLGTDHHELVVRPDAWTLTENLVWHLDEPFADVSAIPTYLVAQLAARHVKVVLSGDGGDEIFAGYDRYPYALAEARRFDWLPGAARATLHGLAALLPDRAPGKNYLRHVALDPRRRFIDGESLFPADLKARLLGPALIEALRHEPDPVDARAEQLARAPGDLLGRLQYFDAMTYLPLDILTKVDRMTMAHSLEARPPLLDHHLAEAVFALPSSLKLRDGEQKWVLKRAVADRVPPEILTRPKKGFGVPIRRWFRGPLREPLIALFNDERTRARGLWEPRMAGALLDEHMSGRRDQSVRLWSLLVLERWCRQFLDGTARTSQPERAYG